MLMLLTRNINMSRFASTVFGSDPYSRSKSEREVLTIWVLLAFSVLPPKTSWGSTTGTAYLASYLKTARQFFKSYVGDVSRGRRYK